MPTTLLTFLFAATIFAGAFLLFQVQPLIAKFILPWFGGSPAVWTTAMLFFQVLLLGGYAYAHLTIRWGRPKAQVALHVALLLVALALLPIVPAEDWKPEADSLPTFRIVALLTVTIGLPYFVLASTSPLLQAWFSRLRPGMLPYRFYALSNAASLLALVSYPFWFEPMFGRLAQAHSWSWGFGGYALVSGACVAWVWRRNGATQKPVADAREATDEIAPTLRTRLLWFALPAVGSILLLAITNEMSQNVAVIPFLWVLPLSLYLLTFIIAFDHERWYYRPVVAGAMLPAALAVVWIRSYVDEPSIVLQVALFSAVLFVCCMACHGEVVRLKPHPRYLTAFYLMIAAGGAAGGAFVALVAPLVFDMYLELHVGLALCCLLVFAVIHVDKQSAVHRIPSWAFFGLGFIGTVVMVGLYRDVRDTMASTVARSRSFYGVLSVVRDVSDSNEAVLRLRHGTIDHGLQFQAPEKRHVVGAYYGDSSGVASAMRLARGSSGRHIGVVGLGVGMLAAYGGEGDRFRFYEIDPDVLDMAETYFSFLADAEAEVEVVLGDARLSLEREASQQFDVLALDAFSGDAIPVHLLTKEAFNIYQRHLKPDAVLAVHISNLHLDLEPVVRQLAASAGLEAVLVSNDEAPNEVWGADWMLLSTNRELLNAPELRDRAEPLPTDRKPVRLWTDDYVNLFQTLR